MAGERLEESSVVLCERRLVSQAIADEHHAEDAIRALQRGDDRIVQVPVGQVVV